MQVKTERGIVSVEASYQSPERAIMDGYTYSFTAHNVYLPDIGKEVKSVDFYGKTLDDKGLKHRFVTILR